MTTRHVHSPDDPALVPYREVRDRDAAGLDGRPGLFIGESPVVIGAMLRSGVETLSILTSDRHAARAEAMVEESRALRAGRPDPEIILAPDAILDATVGFNIHRGFLAVGRRPAQRGVQQVLPAAGTDALLLLVEEINNIDNITNFRFFFLNLTNKDIITSGILSRGTKNTTSTNRHVAKSFFSFT